MGLLHTHSLISFCGLWSLLVTVLTFCTPVVADASTRWVTFTTDEGTVYLADDRRPSLYTGDFGDCQGNSLINVTLFDASLYIDNMTVMFHIEGSTALKNEHIMMYISVFAYGENRFNLIVNPCTIDTPTLCPLNASDHLVANGLLPIGPSDVEGIPNIAFAIPDFEGQAILRIFSNTTESQIACYSAVMSNGNSFAHPAAVGSVLGIFTIVALVSSIAVAVYGQIVPETRKHYAHSVSVFVVFAVFQHIFFTGALSMNWPSVLVAFWTNYAWASGMIYGRGMQNSINKFIGGNFGNISMVGAAPSNQNFANLGGGYDLSQLYKRDVSVSDIFTAPTINVAERQIEAQIYEHSLRSRSLANVSSSYSWYGGPVAPGLPLPGNYSGFAGTLGELKIPASNAFLTGLLWLLILIVIIATLVVSLKLAIESLAAIKLVKTDQFNFFRRHWLKFTTVTLLRLCYIGFFMMTFLALFQFTLGGATGTVALAAVVFIIFVVGLFGSAAYALWYHLRHQKSTIKFSRSLLTSKRSNRDSAQTSTTNEDKISDKADPSIAVQDATIADAESRPHVHDDEDYISKFGWLSSRFRRSKWWFFSAWLVYELVRACFFGAAAGHALTQVFGLLVWEILAFVAIVLLRPFESNRLNLIMVYLLGFSKVATVALSAAFDARFALGRIMCTVIGVIIIVIQGLLTICLLIAICLGAVSSYMSVTRHKEDFKPKAWTNIRTRYFEHINLKDTDKPRPPPPPPTSEPEGPKEPYFAVTTVRRETKIEDDHASMEDVNTVPDGRQSIEPEASNDPYMSRTHSIRSRTSASNLPYGARTHRASWSVRDLQDFNPDHIVTHRSSRMSVEGQHPRMSLESHKEPVVNRHVRSASLRDAATPEARPLSPSIVNPVPSRRRRRADSTPNRARKRASASLNEDSEMEHESPVEEVQNTPQ